MQRCDAAAEWRSTESTDGHQSHDTVSIYLLSSFTISYPCFAISYPKWALAISYLQCSTVAANSSLSEVKRVEEREKERKKRRGEAEAVFRQEWRVTSGRLLEDLSQVGSTMVRALPAISAIEGLWGTRYSRWPTLAALTCAV